MQVFDLQMYGNRRKRLRYLGFNVLKKIVVDKTIGQVIHASENLPAVELEAGKTDSDE